MGLFPQNHRRREPGPARQLKMALRNILKDNHPLLRQRAAEVQKINSAVIRLLDDMRETMHEASGVGLAANQVGVAKRIIIALGSDETVFELINPRCEKALGHEVGIEGCLSVPEVFGEVERAGSIEVSALDREGKPFRLSAEGLLARILQHEMDHLDGVLFTDLALRFLDPEELKPKEQA